MGKKIDKKMTNDPHGVKVEVNTNKFRDEWMSSESGDSLRLLSDEKAAQQM